MSKGMVVDAAEAAGHGPLRWLLLVGAVGTFVSFIKFGYYAFLRGERERVPDAMPVHAAVMIAVAGLCVVLGLRYDLLFSLLPAIDEWTTDPYSLGHLVEAVTLGVVGVVTFLAIRPYLDRAHGGIDVDRVHNPAAFLGVRATVAGVTRVFGVADQSASWFGWHVAWVVHNPAAAIETAVPAGTLRDRYRARRERRSGATGLKLDLEESIALIAVVVGLAIVLSLL